MGVAGDPGTATIQLCVGTSLRLSSRGVKARDPRESYFGLAVQEIASSDGNEIAMKWSERTPALARLSAYLMPERA